MKLVVEGLGYGYPGRSVGRDVSLELGAGEVLCVLGPNGGGKTTLLRTLLGLLPPQGGTIFLDGRPLAAWPRHELARVMAYVPQAHAGHFAFSVCDIVLMGRTAHLGLFAVPAQRDCEAAMHALDTLGITHLAEQPYTRISGGERQLVLIARALAQGATLLVLDEPTAGLDFGNQLRVLQQIDTLAASGIGVVFSTHDPDQAFQCADQALLLRPGGPLCSGAPDAVLNRDNLRELYGVAVDVVELPNGRRACLSVINQERLTK
jgi:iron complex transport system ATP-binding protein